MRSTSNRTYPYRRSFPCNCAGACETLEPRRLLAAVSWDGGGDGTLWFDPLNWSNDALPAPGDDVTISVPGEPNVSHARFDFQTTHVRSLVCDEPLSIYGHLAIATTADVNNVLRLTSGGIEGGVWDVTGGEVTANEGTDNRIVACHVEGQIGIGKGTQRGRLQVEQGATFAHVRMMGTERNSLGFMPGATISGRVSFENGESGIGLVQPGKLTIAADAQLDFLPGPGPAWTTYYIGRSAAFSSAATIVNHADLAPLGNYQLPTFVATSLINRGTIRAVPTPNFHLGMAVQEFVNDGVMRVPAGARLELGGAWDNNGLIDVTGGDLVLGGTFTTARIGTIQRGAGAAAGTVALGGALDNAGATLALDETTGPWLLGRDAVITGGTVDQGGAPRLVPTSSIYSRLRDVNVLGELSLATSDATLLVEGDTRFTAARLSAFRTVLRFGDGYTLRDPVLIDGNGTVRPVGLLTVAPTGGVRFGPSSSGVIDRGGEQARVVNDGLIENATPWPQLSVVAAPLHNRAGTVRVTSGRVEFGEPVQNDAGIELLAPSSSVTFREAYTSATDGRITGAGGVTFFGGTGHVVNTLDVAGPLRVQLTSVTFNRGVRSGAVSVTDGTAALAPGGDKLWVATAIATITGEAQIDLADNGMVIDYAPGANSPLGTPTTTGSVFAHVRSGYAGGAWNGRGIVSSAAAAAPDTALGFGEASHAFHAFPAVFLGLAVDDSAVLIRHTLYGDTNLDHTVNLNDFNALASNFGASPRPFTRGDFNYDGNVNLADFDLLAGNFGRQLGNAARTGQAGAGSDEDDEPTRRS